MREIKQKFIDDLNTGELSFFLQQVKNKSDKLLLAIRDNYINIYYRGGNLLKISKNNDSYAFHFDAKYCQNKGDNSNYELFYGLEKTDAQNHEKQDPKAYVQHFNLMMREMDSWLAVHPKPEREYQHKLMVSNPSVVDIEYQTNERKRFDMLCVENGQLYIVENKYGGGAIGGKAGIAEHYKDICQFISDKAQYKKMLASVKKIIEIKGKLGLLNQGLPFDRTQEPVIVFLFVNYNTKSTQIAKVRASMTKAYPASYIMMDANDTTLNLAGATDFFA